MTAEATPRPATQASAAQLPARQTPVIPEATAPHLTLMTAMAAMCYLATLAIGALLMTSAAVNSWTAQVASEVTVQIKAADGVDLDQAAARAVDILRDTEGITEVDVLDTAVARQLLEPWLGRTQALEDLPVPRLITVSVNTADPPDFEVLRKTLATQVPNAVLDTHRKWQAELLAMAGTLTWLAFAVLGLIAIAASLLVVYATRAAMEVNREVIEVLYLAGARDGFITREVLWRFALTGLKAGLIGAVGGMVTFAALAFAGTRIAAPVRNFLTAPFDGDGSGYFAVLAVPVVATVISLATARISISRTLKAMF